MTEDNRRRIWALIQEAGDYLLGQSDNMVELG